MDVRGGRWSVVALSLLLAAAAGLVARAGTVVTRDGQTLTGDVTLTDGGVTVTPKGGAARTIALKDVAQATLAEPAAATVVAPVAQGPAEAGKVVEPPRRVFVEYFADAAYKDRRLARYETGVAAGWYMKTPPDPAIPAPCYVRYTACVVPPKTQKYPFVVGCYGPVRLWADGQVVIDQWVGKNANSAQGAATLTGRKATVLRLETGPGITLYMASLIYGGRMVGGDACAPLPEAPAAPELSLRLSAGESHYRSPAAIGFDVQAKGTAVARVDLVSETAQLGSVASAPYHFDWRSPAAGVYKIRARATDDKGVSGYSDAVTVSVADDGENHSLPAPWGGQSLGRGATLIPGTASFAGGTFTLTKAGGQINEGDDAHLFCYQPIDGDFTLVARVRSLTPTSDFVAPLAGIVARENMGPVDRFAAVVVNAQGPQFVRRADAYGRPNVAGVGEAAAAGAAAAGAAAEPVAGAARPPIAPTWVKLVRHGNRLRGFHSPDGAAWTLLGADRLDLPPRVFVGLCAMSRDVKTPAVAAIDHVQLTRGSPAMAQTAEGILFRNGTFLAAEVLGLDKNGTLAYTRAGKRVYLPNADVARFVYRPITAEQAEQVPAGRAGALLGSGDYVDGEVKEASYKVVISNVVFGPRTLYAKGGDVLAVYLKEPDPPALPYVVTAADGSVYQSKTMRVGGGTVTLEDPAVGTVAVPAKDVVGVRGN